MVTPTWAHKKRYCRFEDPINLVIQGAALRDVLDRLDAEGWSDPKILFWTTADDLFLRQDGRCDHAQNAHRILGGRIVRRYHVRLWLVDDSIIGGAHYEELSGIGHRVHSFDDGKYKVEEAFRRDTSWTVESNARDLDLRNATDYPEHNGCASRISI